MSTAIFATPAPPTDLPTIYRAGDLVLSNPQETCIIFVSVILISATLEFCLQRVNSVENKYAKILVTTMSQEVTIIGVLALFLMFSISVVPKRLITQLYVTLFSWANLTLFFMATFFVSTVIFQFLWVAVNTRIWKTFEDGRLDSDEPRNFAERLYKNCHEQYRLTLEQRAKFSTTSLPYYEYTATNLRKLLVRLSNLSYRTWLSLSFVVLANLLRTKLTPFVSDSDTDKFNNLLLYVFVVGWGVGGVYLTWFVMLQVKLWRYANGTTPTSDPSELLPLGTEKRCVEFIQIILMSMNWYLTLFVTGNAKEISGLQNAWALGVIYTLFALPLIVFHFTLSWAFYSVAMLVTIGKVKPGEALKLKRRFKGEIDAGSSSDDEDGDAPPPKKKKKDSDKGSQLLGGARRGSVASSASTVNQRPQWLEEDDDWDGTRTYVPGERRVTAQTMDQNFFRFIQPDTVRYKLMQGSMSPHRDGASSQQEMLERPLPPGTQRGDTRERRGGAWSDGASDL